LLIFVAFERCAESLNELIRSNAVPLVRIFTKPFLAYLNKRRSLDATWEADHRVLVAVRRCDRVRYIGERVSNGKRVSDAVAEVSRINSFAVSPEGIICFAVFNPLVAADRLWVCLCAGIQTREHEYGCR
jgi:hypothetical protein